MRRIPTAAAAVTAGLVLGTASLSAQVVINEVHVDQGDQWIELYNPSAAEVVLGSWSIYHATKTPNRVGDYWWPFPSGLKIKGNDYLRILWGSPIGTTNDPRDIQTGDTRFHFLFGHGFEALNPQQGALAICKTQDNAQVNGTGVFADWWQWGATGFPRENLAVGASLWSAGQFAPVIPATASMMLLGQAVFPHTPTEFFHDYSPTPLSVNVDDASTKIEGKACSWRKPTDVGLEANGIPFHGNNDFAITVTNTQGPAFFEAMFLVVNLGPKTTWGKCDVLSLSHLNPHLMSPFIATESGSTRVPAPLTLDGLGGHTFYTQAVVFSTSATNNYFGFSNFLVLKVSN